MTDDEDFDFDDEFFDLKAKALVFSLIETFGDEVDRTDEMNLVVADLDLTEDAYDLLLSMAGLAATFVVMMAESLSVDAGMLWHQLVGG